MNKKEILLNCECGHGILKFTKYDDDDGSDIYLEYYEDVFYSYQRSFISKLVENIKLSTKILLGRKFVLFDIVVLGKDFEEFKSNLLTF